MRSNLPSASVLGALVSCVLAVIPAGVSRAADAPADHNSIAIGADPEPSPPVRAKASFVRVAAPKPAPKPGPKSHRQAILIGAPERPALAPTPLQPIVPDAWPVAISLKSTLREWALRANWPPPQFLTDSDWPVDVPGAIPGTIQAAIQALPQGFSRASSRPRIEVTENHVILVSETNP